MFSKDFRKKQTYLVVNRRVVGKASDMVEDDSNCLPAVIIITV